MGLETVVWSVPSAIVATGPETVVCSVPAPVTPVVARDQLVMGVPIWTRTPAKVGAGVGGKSGHSTCMHYEKSTCMHNDHSTCMDYDHSKFIMSYSAHLRRN